MPSYLITGSGRGLGLSFVTHLLQDKDNVVVATARDTAASPGLQKLKQQGSNGRLILIDLDVSKLESVRKAAEETAKVLPKGLDHLISSAGLSTSGPLKTFDEMDIEELKQEVNFPVVSLLLLVREFLPLVRKSEAKKILVISSVVGSLTIAPSILDLGNGYGIARAALNMTARKWSGTLKAQDVTIAIIHPGWVDSTDMGSTIIPWAEKNPASMSSITAEQSANDVMQVLHSMTIKDAGSFFNHDGTQIPW